MASWRRAFRLHLRGGTVEQDVDDEIAFHLEMRTRDLIEEDGLEPAAACEEALRRFGGMEEVRRRCREIGRQTARGRRWTEIVAELRQDAVFALRQLRKTPVFALIAVATLALGVGATTAIFSLLHAVVLKPLPFPHPERIVQLWRTEHGEDRSLSAASFLGFREARSFSRLAASWTSSFNLTGDGPPERILGDRVSAGYFEAFGVRPELGRVFTAAEDRPGRNRVVVLSDRLWRERFAADPRVVGRTFRLNGIPYEVIGVLPASFELRTVDSRLWVPVAFTPEQASNFGNSYLRVTGRLRPGVSLAAAEAEVAAISKRLEPLDEPSRKGQGTRLEPFVDRLLGGYRKRLLILLGAVGCVLLIACVNVANLLLARGGVRAREIAVRAALGAGRGRIVRQLLTESLVLGLAGGVAGLGLAQAGVRFLKAISPAGVPRLATAGIDGTALAFALGLSLAASLLFGLVPALRTARPDLQSMLKEGGRAVSSPRDRVRTGLLVAEVALALVLLVGAGLLIRSAVRLQEVEVGFDPSNLLTAQLSLPFADYASPDRAVKTVLEAVDRTARIPGVASAAAVSILPLSSRSNSSSTLDVEGLNVPEEGRLIGNTREVTPGYFTTLRIPLLRGRDFTPRDRAGAPYVAVVNRKLARLAWGSEEVLGKRLAYTRDEKGPVWMEVVGVAGDIRQGDLADETRAEVYLPLEQANSDLLGEHELSVALVVRAQGDAAAVAGPLRQAVLATDPRLPVFNLLTMEEIRASLSATTRFNMLLLTALGTIGLLLAAVGIYGVIAYFVSQRTQEIGVRMALGATEGKVLSLVVWQAMRPVLLGLVVGLAGAAAAGRAIAGLLFGVSTTDPATFAGVILVLAAAALLASWLPAKRAARVEPTRALAP
ncbi:MAG TPA: ABC transporter permease [Thermoanaerobaculia bacterium]|nr:ABC transporter permease [Thermoanaerobaculia bacterium]